MRLQQLCSVLNGDRAAGGASPGKPEQTAHNPRLKRRLGPGSYAYFFRIYCIYRYARKSGVGLVSAYSAKFMPRILK